MDVLLAWEVLAYYARGEEDQRLRTGAGRLEYWRTQDVLRRLLPPNVRVLDVGGGSGIHAQWLAGDGHRVELIDPVPLHVSQASRAGLTARLGNILDLDADDGAFDVVLLLGPLYHLTEPAERLRALREARRVTRVGGLVVAATINRFAPVHDVLRTARYFEPDARARVEATARSGVHRPSNAEALFTTAYFHAPDEIAAEVRGAGLDVTGQYGVEGAAWLMGGPDRPPAPDRARSGSLRLPDLAQSGGLSGSQPQHGPPMAVRPRLGRPARRGRRPHRARPRPRRETPARACAGGQALRESSAARICGGIGVGRRVSRST